MAWIESHTVLRNHRKVLLLSRSLRLNIAQTIGHLHLLWHAALEQQEDGNLSKWTDELIAELAGYSGDAPQFVRLLQEFGWFDGKVIHDWWEYAGRYLQSKYGKTPEKWQTIKSKLAEHHQENIGAPTDHQQTTSRVPYIDKITKPNQTKPKTKDIPPGQPAESADTALAVKSEPKTKQARFVECFAASYKSMTGSPYKADQKDYVLASKLISAYGYDMLVAKTQVLGALCRDRSAWFAKSWGDFTIGKLSSNWNNIVPQETDEQRKRRESDEALKRAEESRAKAERTINAGRQTTG